MSTIGIFASTKKKILLFDCISFILLSSGVCNEEFCRLDSDSCDSIMSKDRFLLYDVNPPEGFNLRRDVYMRFVILAHKLKELDNGNLQNFKLVLPPWSHMVHWEYNAIAEQLPWGLYFDLNSLKSFAPVIEMYEFFQTINQTYNVVIDEAYILQHFEDMFESGKFEDKMEVAECSKNDKINYFFYSNITSRSVKCLSYHGPATKLSELLAKSSAKIILFHHAEVALHEMFGNKLYWRCRRSMRFNKDLRRIANEFRKKYFNSTDELDNTILPEDWRREKPERGAKGGFYISVHLRRKDFLRGHGDKVPSIGNIAEQIIELLEKLNLTHVFVATDASDDEYKKLIETIPLNYKILKYIPSKEVKKKYRDGGVAIIDQIICSHAKYFVGTGESTFSFRIQEEREILGFPVETTFNSFCKTGNDCVQPSVWKIVY